MRLIIRINGRPIKQSESSGDYIYSGETKTFTPKQAQNLLDWLRDGPNRQISRRENRIRGNIYLNAQGKLEEDLIKIREGNLPFKVKFKKTKTPQPEPNFERIKKKKERRQKHQMRAGKRIRRVAEQIKELEQERNQLRSIITQGVKVEKAHPH